MVLLFLDSLLFHTVVIIYEHIDKFLFISAYLINDLRHNNKRVAACLEKCI